MKKFALFLIIALSISTQHIVALDDHSKLSWSALIEQKKAIFLQDQSNALNRVWDGELTVDGKTYRSLELYYHMQKVPVHLHDTFLEKTEGLEGLELNTKIEALRKEHGFELPEKWMVQKKFDIMHRALKTKFSNNNRQDLMDTGNAFLIQGPSNVHHQSINQIWGTLDDGRGSNHVGRILMLVRQELLDKKDYHYDPEKTFSLPEIEKANYEYNTSLFNGQEKE